MKTVDLCVFLAKISGIGILGQILNSTTGIAQGVSSTLYYLTFPWWDNIGRRKSPNPMWFSWQKLYRGSYHRHTVATGILILPAQVTDKGIIIIVVTPTKMPLAHLLWL